ncbi:MAG: hypothetical protein NT040_01935 [Bacteroidetes bacterium]|nr:hypothetical protein [Bacteroidota bacterium]
MKKLLLSLILLTGTSMLLFSQEPTKSETQEFIKSKLQYYLFDIYEAPPKAINHKRYFEFDSNCSLIQFNEFDEKDYQGVKHIRTRESIDIADIQDVEIKSNLLIITLKTKSNHNYNQETDVASQKTKVTQDDFFNSHTFQFKQSTDVETIERLTKAFKHLSKLCGNKTNLDLFK